MIFTIIFGFIRDIITLLIINYLTLDIDMKKGLPKKSFISDHLGFTVTRMGLEPMTPTLKVLCSTS